MLSGCWGQLESADRGEALVNIAREPNEASSSGSSDGRHQMTASGSKGQKEPIRGEDLRELTQRFAGHQASLSDVRAITICLIYFFVMMS